MAVNIGLKRGDRALVVGQSGSGKTFLSLQLARALPRPVLIVDTKWSGEIARAAKKYGWTIDTEDVPELNEGVVVWRPGPDLLADPMGIDAVLDNLVRNQQICSVYIDELYQLHRQGRAGPGIIGLYTRGREMGFTTLACSQRPAWVSQFCKTEASHYIVMRLLLPDDRKNMAEMMGAPQIRDTALEKRWYWYAAQGEQPILMRPYKIPPQLQKVLDAKENPTILKHRKSHLLI
jgi:ABC-type dipeptide/oligopeptide/nickel transport system ATPase component